MLRKHRDLIFILLLGLGLRFYLVSAGGQFFWPDEERYLISRLAANELLDGDLWGTFYYLHSAEHFLFKVIGVIPALLEQLLGEDTRIPGAFFSLFSVLNLYLVNRIARALGATEREAIFASLFMSLSTTFFYYSRHLLPYDFATSLGLGALLLAVRQPATNWRAFWCGFLALASLLTYNGYWLLALFAILVLFLSNTEQGRKNQLRYGVLSVLGFAAPLAALLLTSRIYAPDPLDQQFLSFTTTITQGDFTEGWSLPFAYFWHADHLLFLFWLAALGLCAWWAWQGQRGRRIVLGLGGLLFIYSSLVFVSVVLQKFVVYGRLARQMVPFFCLLGALVLERLWNSKQRGRRAASIVLAVLILQAAINFYSPVIQSFPADFRQRVRDVRNGLEPGQFEFVNVHFIHPETLAEVAGDIPHQVILELPHPLEYLPYQYEGYTPEKRAYLRAADISMSFVVYEGVGGN